MCVRFAEGLFGSTGKCFWGDHVSSEKEIHFLTEGPNILGRLLPKRHRVRLVQLKETLIVLLAKNIWLFAIGILQARGKFISQERLE